MTDLDRFTRSFHAHFTRDPNARVNLGVDRDLGEVPDPSLAAAEATAAAARALQAEATLCMDNPSLGFHEKLDLELAHDTLAYEIFQETHTWDGRTRRQQLPEGAAELGDPVFLLFVSDPRPAADRLSDITSRLEAAPAFLDAMLARLDRPLTRWVNMDLESAAELPDLFATVEGWAAARAPQALPRYQAARATAEAALADYRARLAALPSSTALHLGLDQAREVIRLRGIDLSAEQLHGMARDFLAETHAVLEELRGRLVAKYGLPADTTQKGLQEHLAQVYRVPVVDGRLESVLDRYREEHERILAFIGARDLFPIFPDQELRLLRTPGFMAPSIPAGAMMPAPPFRPGTATSLVYLTLSEELLDEHTELGIPGMMIHEGIPGHHLQLATAGRHPSIIRRHQDANDLAEGWTTMLEDYMLDEGYMGELTDEARFVTKRDISRLGARVAIDLYFMSGERGFLDVGVDCDLSSPDPFVAAGHLLRAVTGFVPGRVEAELNWYSAERGYPLSYLTGNKLVWALKRDVAEANRGQLVGHDLDRAFHRTYLASGNMPVRHMRRVFAHEGLLGPQPEGQ